VRYYYNVRGLWDERRLRNYAYRVAAARQLADRSELVLALAQRAEVLCKQDTLDEAATWLAQAEQAAAEASLHTDAAFELCHARGLLAYTRGDLRAAETYWRELLPFAATLDPQKHIINRRWLATCLLDQGRVEEAIGLYRESLEDARRANDTRSVTGNTLKLAAIDLARGDLAAAEASLAECRKAATRYDDRRRLAECYHLTAKLRRAQGDTETWRAELERAIDLFERMGMQRAARLSRQEHATAAPRGGAEEAGQPS